MLAFHILNSSTVTTKKSAKWKQIHFFPCFWGTSYLNLCDTVEKCPSCMNRKVESMPIPDKELYTFDYDASAAH